MKNITTCFFFLLVALTTHAQNSWVQKNDFPGAKRYGTTSCVIGDKVYFGLGSNGNVFYFDWWEYDPASDTWTQKSDFGGGTRDVAVSMVLDGKAYVGLGAANIGAIEKDWWEYDPSNDSWTEKNDFPGFGRYGTTSFVIDDMGYMCCGNEGSAFGPFVNELWQYDPSTDSWTQKTSMPGYARYGTTGFAINGKGYSGLGGLKKSNGSYMYFKDFYEYDPVNDAWTQKSDYPSRRAYPVEFVLNDKGYVGVGDKQGNLHPEIYSYDPAADAWTYETSFPDGGRFVASGFAVNGVAYVGLGAGSIPLASFHNDVWQFTPQEKVAPVALTKSDCSLTYLSGSHQVIPTFNDEGVYEFTFYDISGHLIQLNVITETSPINLSTSLPKGIYVAQLRSVNGASSCTKKIAIQ